MPQDVTRNDRLRDRLRIELDFWLGQIKIIGFGSSFVIKKCLGFPIQTGDPGHDIALKRSDELFAPYRRGDNGAGIV